jgi:hypothetical protein
MSYVHSSGLKSWPVMDRLDGTYPTCMYIVTSLLYTCATLNARVAYFPAQMFSAATIKIVSTGRLLDTRCSDW